MTPLPVDRPPPGTSPRVTGAAGDGRGAVSCTQTAAEDVKHVIHGTTLVTNSIIERKGARTALLTTKGFRDAYEIAREHRPDLRILFVTGYAEHATDRGRFLAPGMEMIGKPFTYQELGTRIRAVLDRP